MAFGPSLTRQPCCAATPVATITAVGLAFLVNCEALGFRVILSEHGLQNMVYTNFKYYVSILRNP